MIACLPLCITGMLFGLVIPCASVRLWQRMPLICDVAQMTTAMDRMSGQRTPSAQGGAAQMETPRGGVPPRSATALRDQAPAKALTLLHLCHPRRALRPARPGMQPG